jgi:nucleotide-binding universal stress UspA family protein
MLGFTVEQRAGDIAGTEPRQAVFHDIVCGVNGSRGSRLATHQAIALSGRDGTIRFVAAHHTEGFGLNEVSTLSERRAVDALDQAVWQAESRGVHATRVLCSAAGAGAALRSEAAGHELLVVGSHGGSRAGGIVLGGIVTQLTHGCEQPLLIARRTIDHGEFAESVLFATDGSAGSWAAARLVARLAARRGSEVHLVHVPDHGGSRMRRQVHEQLMLIAGQTGRPPGLRDKAGPVAERICEAARASQCSLLVLGRRGVGGLKALGSVSERVAHRVSCSVLLVPTGERVE